MDYSIAPHAYDYSCTQCDRDCKVRQVKKEGKNQGKWFYCCDKNNGGCGKFEWMNLNEDGTGVAPAPNENPRDFKKRKFNEFFNRGNGNAPGAANVNSDLKLTQNETLTQLAEQNGRILAIVIGIQNTLQATASLADVATQVAERVLQSDEEVEEDASPPFLLTKPKISTNTTAKPCKA